MAKSKNNGKETAEAAAVDAIEAKAAETLRRDTARAMMQEIQDAKNQKPWAQMTEKEQSEVIYRVQRAADDLVERACHLIAAKGFEHIDALFEDAGSWKDGEFKFVLKARATTDNFAKSRRTAAVQIVLADANAYDRGEPIKPQPDQTSLLQEGAAAEAVDPETGEVTETADEPVFDNTEAGAAA